MQQPAHLVFVCQSLRDPDNPRGSGTRRGSKAVREDMGRKHQIRVPRIPRMGSTCLGSRVSGVTVLVVDSREGATYYGRMDPPLGEALIREGLASQPSGPTASQRHRLRPDDLLDLSALNAEAEPKP